MRDNRVITNAIFERLSIIIPPSFKRIKKIDKATKHYLNCIESLLGVEISEKNLEIGEEKETSDQKGVNPSRISIKHNFSTPCKTRTRLIQGKTSLTEMENTNSIMINSHGKPKKLPKIDKKLEGLWDNIDETVEKEIFDLPE
jgi:hypothetical protein